MIDMRTHCMAQDEAPNVSVCALHSSFMSSTTCAWAFVVCEDTNIHDRFLRDEVYRESQLIMGWTEQVQSVRLNCKKRTIHIISLQRNREDTKDNGISPWTSQSKSEPMKLRSDFRAAVSMKIVFTRVKRKKLKSPLLQNNRRDGIPLETHRGGTSLNGIGIELIRFVLNELFVTVGFVCSWWWSTVTDGCV